MKLNHHFNDFMTDTVNLNATRLQQLEDSVEALKTAIRDSDWKPKVRGFAGQGSWKHQTIIKPVDKKPFDADVLVFVEPKEGWEAKAYVNSLYDVFANHGTYKDKVSRSSHCVTVAYAGERQIDIAPCVVGRGGGTLIEVCNRTSNAFERSEPTQYTDWLIERNGWTGGNGLRKTTRLLKYLRDIKTTFSCSSVLFTTLLGFQITEADDTNTTDFADVPTALRSVVGRLDDWLQARQARPTVTNPVLSTEVLSTSWDDTRYANFRDKIHTYRGWIDDAYAEADRDESIGKWRRVFGDEFAKSVTVEEAAAVSIQAVALAKSAGFAANGFIGDLVSLFVQWGTRVLPPGFGRLSHMERPQWKALAAPVFSIEVAASLHSARNGVWLEMGFPLPKGRWLQFQARTRVGTPLAADHDIYWRVTNTDKEAEAARCLRGGFVKANDGSSHWEELAYRGVHMVEAFVVRKRDKALVAQSAPYFVAVA